MVAILVIITVLTFLTIDYFVQRAKARVEVPAQVPAGARPLGDLGRIPTGAFLAPGHAWMRLEPHGAVAVGSDALPFALLGGLDRVDLPPAGAEVRRGGPLAVLRRGAHTLTLRAPIDGRIEEVAPDLERVAADPHGDGWLCRITPQGLSDALRHAFVAEEATAWMRGEVARLRDFLAATSMARQTVGATLHDGGLPADGLVSCLEPGEWDELVHRFFDLPAPEPAGTIVK